MWENFRKDFINNRTEDQILRSCPARFHYGDLRLSRLNWICRLTCRGHFYNSRDPWASFWEDYGKWIALVFAYTTIVLVAMQVMLAASTDPPPFPLTISKIFRWSAYVVMLLVVGQVPVFILVIVYVAVTQIFGWCKGRYQTTL